MIHHFRDHSSMVDNSESTLSSNNSFSMTSTTVTFISSREDPFKRSSVNSFVTVKFDKRGTNKHDATSRKLSYAQEKVRRMLNS